MSEGQEVHFWMTASTRVGEGMPTRRVTAAPTKAGKVYLTISFATLRVAF